MLNKLKKSQKGEKKMLKFNDDFNNTLGIEIELISKVDREELYSILERNGVSYTFTTRSYTHEVVSGWKVVTDSSLNISSSEERQGFKYGLEIVSPILNKETFGQTQIILDLLQGDSRFKVNVNCAVHVHFGAKNLPLDVLKGAIKNYVKHETAIKSTLPNSRRDRGYNQSMTIGMEVKDVRLQVQKLFGKINRAANHEALARTFRNHFQDVSLSSYFRQGTIEFRAHGGTLDFEKVNNWVVFLSNLFQAKNKLGNKSHSITARFGKVWEESKKHNFERTFFYLLNRNHEALEWFKSRAESVNREVS